MILQCRGVDDPTLPAEQQLSPGDLLDLARRAALAARSTTPRRSGATTCTPTDADQRARSPGIDAVPAPECHDVADLLRPTSRPSRRQRHGLPGLHAPTHAARGGGRRGLPAGRDRGLHRRDGNGAGAVRGAHRRRERVARLLRQGRLLDRGHPDRRASAAVDDATRRLPAARAASSRPGSSNFANEGVDRPSRRRCGGRRPTGATGSPIPITFGLPPDACDVLDSRPPTGFYGSELMAQASLQWSPAYCLDKKRFKFQHNKMSDEAGFNLMESGGGAAAFVSGEHEARGTDPVGLRADGGDRLLDRLHHRPARTTPASTPTCGSTPGCSPSC